MAIRTPLARAITWQMKIFPSNSLLSFLVTFQAELTVCMFYSMLDLESPYYPACSAKCGGNSGLFRYC